MPITRRALLALLSSSTYFLTATSRPVAALVLPEHLSPANFPQGVASGDPQADAIMLWTRAVPTAGSKDPMHLVLELAWDESFSELVLSADVACDERSDYTLRTYVRGLQSDTRYYYRFRGGQDTVSRVGRTRTAPAPTAERTANVAFASCQSYEQALYGSWARMIAQDKAAAEDEQIDFVLHLGDFIYERSWHTRVDGTEQSRRLPDFPDGVETELNRYAVSLADYRHLYKTYLSDPHLQEARARWPFICTWDDHEYANDNFQSYSTYSGQIVLDPDRKQRSNQAWFEYIPTVLDELTGQPASGFREGELGRGDAEDNQTAVESLCIYRKLNWGKYLDILLTDTRSYRSERCLPEGFEKSIGLPLNPVKLVEIADAGREYNGGNPPATLPYGDGDIPNPAQQRAPGTLLGKYQRDWFLDTLERSSANWKLWGNALPLIPMRLDLSAMPFVHYEDSLINLDAWAGFPYEHAYLMDTIAQRGIYGVVSLSGDHHLHGAGTVNRSASEPAAPAVSVDFAVAGISSSPVFEDLVAAAGDTHGTFSSLVFMAKGDELEPVWHMSMLDGVRAATVYSLTGMQDVSRWLGPNEANHGLKFTDTSVNGYGLACFERDQLSVQMVAMEDCRADFDDPPQVRYVANFRLPHWSADEEPQLQGPEFTGSVPFPFS